MDPYVSSSTSQDRDVRDYGYQLLSGDSEKNVTLTLRGATGRERNEEVSRDGYKDVSYPPQFQFPQDRRRRLPLRSITSGAAFPA